jgi:imidazolonepropionase-like amidohydrolase
MTKAIMTRLPLSALAFTTGLICLAALPGSAQTEAPSAHSIVLHAQRLLDIETGRMVTPGEVLVEGERIVEAGSAVRHPAGATVIDLGDRTLLPGLIDAHVHLFLHPGAEDLQTVKESVP